MKNISHMAIEKGDSSLWTPEQAIEDLLSQGLDLKRMVLIYEHEIEGKTKQGGVCAGIKSRYEHIGMVSTYLHGDIKDAIE